MSVVYNKSTPRQPRPHTERREIRTYINDQPACFFERLFLFFCASGIGCVGAIVGTACCIPGPTSAGRNWNFSAYLHSASSA